MSRLLTFLLLFTMLTACVYQQSETLQKPSGEEVIKALNTANDYFMNKFPDPGADLIQPVRSKGNDFSDGRIWQSNIWTFSTYATGLMTLYNTTNEQRHLDYLIDWGEKKNWTLPTEEMWNDHLAGQTYIDLYTIDTTKKEYISDIKSSIDAFIFEGDTQGRRFGTDWNWIDAAYMAMPLFAQLGALTGDDVYYEKMHELYLRMKNETGGGLYNPEDGLWWRDASFKPPHKEPNGENLYWSRGNGWVVGALVRTLNYLPEEAPNRDEYKSVLKEMFAALLKVQREDGLWNVSLHDPTNYGGKELTGSAFFIYGMAWGVNNGLIYAEKYAPAIYKGWNTLVEDCMHPNGFLGYVQGTGDEPSSGQPVTYDSMPDFEDYGLGMFLLAGTEVYKING